MGTVLLCVIVIELAILLSFFDKVNGDTTCYVSLIFLAFGICHEKNLTLSSTSSKKSLVSFFDKVKGNTNLSLELQTYFIFDVFNIMVYKFIFTAGQKDSNNVDMRATPYKVDQRLS